MERQGLMENLRSTTMQRREELQNTDYRTLKEHQQQSKEAVARYVAENKERIIDQLAVAAMEAAERGTTTAKVKAVDAIEHRDSLYQTAREVRDYFKQEGFKVELETAENGYIHYYGTDNKEYKESTECIAMLGISWKK